MASCLAVTAIIFVLITTVAIIVAFSTPNWLKFEGLGELCQCRTCDCGLWLQCSEGSTSLNNCVWFFSENFRVERGLPDWFKAVQGLMACAVASTILALFIGLFSLCCACAHCNANIAAGAFANLTFVLMAITVCVFGAKAYMEQNAGIILQQGSLSPVYGWSFWVAVGGAGMSLITSLMYFCIGRSDEYKYN